ncbi:MAG: hypothetical protein LQ337_005466 [Flavoplaca oasis]|nr:MAG: hypothetical protein LQ337_005466 [Flavoplaca oasis]
MQDMFPTPTFAGLRAAQVDLGIEPTSAPPQHEILKRLSGDPAICGWVEGNSSMFQKKTGYNKTVLTTTTLGVIPFGQAESASTTSSETDAQQASVTAAAPSPSSSSEVDMTLISGGAIAGAVAGSVLALAAIVGIFLFFRRRHRVKREQERLAATRMSERTSIVYAQYAKPPPSTLSPPNSPPMHSRHPSDHGYGFPSSPPMSDRPWSPETVANEVAELGAGDEATNVRKP